MRSTAPTPSLRTAPRAAAKYNPQRGAKVIAFARDFLDQHFALADGSHRDAVQYRPTASGLEVQLKSGETTRLKNAAALQRLAGRSRFAQRRSCSSITACTWNCTSIARTTSAATIPAGISDVVLESAITTIQDCEDSVAAVDADDKIHVYRNWLGLMKGGLEARVEKGDKPRDSPLECRSPVPDARRQTIRAAGTQPHAGSQCRPPHALQHRDSGRQRPSRKPSSMRRSPCSSPLHDLRGVGARRNSRSGSVYVVKPKMHGPDEVAFADELFGAVEDLLGLPQNTVKIGIMDEERRTSVNLMECIRAARQRVAFINTGFLDRTGDDIHTSMEAGAVPRKSDIKKAGWLDAYERQNVDIGLACGLRGIAQIGKGMWAMPDLMADMLKAKIAHPLAGANTAWVPSPTAATLHALHYHVVDVAEVQVQLAKRRACLIR